MTRCPVCGAGLEVSALVLRQADAAAQMAEPAPALLAADPGMLTLLEWPPPVVWIGIVLGLLVGSAIVIAFELVLR